MQPIYVGSPEQIAEIRADARAQAIEECVGLCDKLADAYEFATITSAAYRHAADHLRALLHVPPNHGAHETPTQSPTPSKTNQEPPETGH